MTTLSPAKPPCPHAPCPCPPHGAGLPRGAVAALSQPWPRPGRIPPRGRAVPGGPGRSRAAPGRGDISREKGAGGGIRHCRPGSAGPAPQVGRGRQRAPGAGGHVNGSGWHRERHGHRDGDADRDSRRGGDGGPAQELPFRPPGRCRLSPGLSPRQPWWRWRPDRARGAAGSRGRARETGAGCGFRRRRAGSPGARPQSWLRSRPRRRRGDRVPTAVPSPLALGGSGDTRVKPGVQPLPAVLGVCQGSPRWLFCWLRFPPCRH